MKQRYHLFRRENGVFYSLDAETGRRESLKTANREEALRLLHASNEASRQPAMNLQIARVYLHHSDPAYSTRTWQHVMDEMARHKNGETRLRWERAMKEKSFDIIRGKILIETKSQHFLDVLAAGTVSTNVFLRRLQNYAVDMDWLPKAIIPRKRWPKIEFKTKRAITFEEHQKILSGERNPEWLAFYKTLWHLGGAQTDVANLRAEDVDWKMKVISFNRCKTGSLAQLHFGPELENILNDLPGEGLLFPRISQMKESDRASLFSRRCRLVGVKSVSLHSYRYAWAERAREAGYPERFAQEALGHNSIAVHRAYAKKAKVKIPSLEDYEKKLLRPHAVGEPNGFIRHQRCT